MSGFSAAAADAFELGVQQLVAFVRHSLGIGVVAVATIACELRSVHSVATEAPTKSVTASCIGRKRQCRQTCHPQGDRDNSGSRRARHFEPFLSLDHVKYDSRPKGGIEADGITVVRAGFVLARSERFELPARSSPRLRDRWLWRSSRPSKARLVAPRFT